MPLFGKSSKSPVELVRVLKESLLVLEKGGDGKKQAREVLCVLEFAEDRVIALSGTADCSKQTNSSSHKLTPNELLD